jgi:hypothetical protein
MVNASSKRLVLIVLSPWVGLQAHNQRIHLRLRPYLRPF